MCVQTNSTYLECPSKDFDEHGFMGVAIYVPREGRKNTVAKMKVPHGNIKVEGEEGVHVAADVICRDTHEKPGVKSIHDCDLYFTFDSDFGFHYFHVIASPDSIERTFSEDITTIANQKHTLVMDNLSTPVRFNYAACYGKSTYCAEENFTLDFKHFNAYQNVTRYDNDGAYLFRPDPADMEAIQYWTVQSSSGLIGDVVQMIRIVSDKLTVDLKLIKGDNHGIYTDVDFYGIEKQDVGQDVVMRIEVENLNSDKTFYTDSLGLEMQKRVLNWRPTWDFTTTQPVASNFYPVNTAIVIRDEETGVQFNVLNDRSQAGSSLHNGQIDLMIQRRLYFDDDRGVEEALDEHDEFGNGLGVTAQLFSRC